MRRSIISLVAGVLLAVIAIVIMRLYVGAVTRASEPSEAEFTVVAVMAADIASGSVLEPKNIQLVRWPASSVPSGAFSSVDAIFKGAQTPEDRIALVGMVRGEPVLRGKVSGLGAKPILSAMVGPNMRAISIKIDDVSGVSGFILPGDHVDIMLTRRVAADLVTDVLLQSVKVLGIDQLAESDRTKPMLGHTATVEVTPEQAGRLVLAQQAGTLSLSLRNPDNVKSNDMGRIGEADLSRRTGPRAGGVNVIVRYGTVGVGLAGQQGQNQ